MNKLIKIALLSALLVTSTSHAGLFDSAMTSGWEDKNPSAKYKLDVYGFDVRVYEWIPKDNPNVRCVFVAGNENSSGVACYDVKEEK